MDYQVIIQYVIEAVMWIFHIISAVLCFKGYHVLCKHDNNNSTEVDNMKYRTPNSRETEIPVQQSFSPLVTQYRFNKEKNELEELPNKLDVQKLVDSSLNTALEAMFDKFLNVPIDPGEAVIDDKRDMLDRLTSAMETSEAIKDELKMDEFASLSDVRARLESDISAELAKQAAEKEKQAAEAADKSLYEKFKAFVASEASHEA